MYKSIKKLILPEGQFDSEVTVFEDKDLIEIKNVFSAWEYLNKLIYDLGSQRKTNLPEIISEGLFCILSESVRVIKNIPKVKTSFDCYNFKTKKRIQIKGASSLGPTSFGPESVWDELYFINFYNNGNVDGTYEIYLIDDKLINNISVNKKQTMKEQQTEKRRPRFSIYKKIIKPNKIQPIYTGKL